MTDYYILSWWDFEHQLCLLSKKIIDKGFQPEVLVAILWNGAIVGKYLADLLDINHVEGLVISYYKGIDARRSKVRIQTHVFGDDIKNKKVLLIDDIADTGQTLTKGIEILKNLGAREVITATLFTKPNSKFIPNIYNERTSKWIVFPWEYGELIRKEKGNMTVEEVKNKLGLNAPINSDCLFARK